MSSASAAGDLRKDQLRLAGLSILFAVPHLIVMTVSTALSNSSLILADLVANSLDFLALFLVWLVLRERVKGRSFRLDYGYGKVESLGAFCVSLVTILSILIIGTQAIHRILYDPEPLEGAGIHVGLVANLVNGAINATFFAIYRRLARRDSSPIAQTQKHIYQDKLFTSTILIGSLASSLALADWKFGMLIDPISTILYLGFSAYFSSQIMAHSLQDLLDVSCSEEVKLIVIRSLAQSFDAFDDLGAILTRRSGDQIFVEIDLGFQADRSIGEIDAVAKLIREQIQAELPGACVKVAPRAVPAAA